MVLLDDRLDSPPFRPGVKTISAMMMGGFCLEIVCSTLSFCFLLALASRP